jgi:uncharacterized protein YdeI (YjbR/CyaY-like superfamily)
VGIYKRNSDRSGITVREAQDQALCFGWIDSKGRRIDEGRWMLRLSPRRPGSNWSEVNLARVEELRAQGLMHESGIRALESRKGSPVRGRRTAR